jgi:lipopolysaccharide assembly outer membrane protein LptD (OstA)
MYFTLYALSLRRKIRISRMPIIFRLLMLSLLLALPPSLWAQTDDSPADSAAAVADSLSTPEEATGGLRGPVNYRADIISANPLQQTMVLRGRASIEYDKYTLEAGVIRVDWRANLVWASPDTGIDSTGHTYVFDYPLFIESNSDTLRAESLVYNIETEQGKLIQGRTKESSNYYRGKEIRKITQRTMMIRDGYFTTCSNDTPHYYFGCQQMQMTVDDKIVGRDITFAIAEIPLAYLPFGVFPNKQGRQSGFLLPRYEYSEERGRTLREIGYYWAINDYMDAEISTDFFEKRGLLYRGNFNYRQRYWYSGFVKGEFTPVDISTGAKRERWRFDYSHNHTINPNTRISASGTFISDRNYNSDLYATIENRVDQSLFNNVAFSTRWPESQNSLNINLQSNQNLNTGSYSYTLPNMRFAHAQRRLFGNAPTSNNAAPWEQIYYSYNFALNNQFDYTVLEETDSTRVVDENERRAVQHAITLNAPLKIFKYINFTPALNYSEVWQDKFFSTLETDSGTIVREQYGFRARRTFNANLALRTTVFGVFNTQIGNLRSLRHKMDPSISMSFQPDFSDPAWGYTTTYTNSEGETVTVDAFRNSIFGGTPSGQRASLNFALSNLFQAKYISSGNEKKTDLFRVNMSGNYNFTATEKPLSNISTSFNASPDKNFSLQGSFSHSPYAFNEAGTGTVDRYLGLEGGFLRLQRFNLASGFSLTGDEISESLATAADSIAEEQEEFYQTGNPISRRQREDVIRGLKDNAFSWQLRGDLSYSYDGSNRNNIRRTFDFVPSVVLNLTKNWRIRWQASLDIADQKIDYQRFAIYRDLHCWEMSFEWSPNVDFPSASYFFLKIGLKNPLLEDLKVEHSNSGSPYF